MTAAPTSALTQGESAQGYLADPRNDSVLVYVNGEYVPRDEARVSIFDSGFVLGDGVWEGLRVVGGHPVFLEGGTIHESGTPDSVLKNPQQERTRAFLARHKEFSF